MCPNKEKGCIMKRIFEPAELGGLRLKNRLVRSATWEGVAAPDGGIADVAYEIYDELAAGGVGAIITGFTSVADEDHYFDGMMRLSRDELVGAYARLADVIHGHDCPAIAQLALGAFFRQTPSGLAQVEPDDMTEGEIERVIGQFVSAARRAAKAGFDGVQIHVAHFFFLSRFVSPAANHRTDAWGGSTEKRARIVCEIIAGIREAAPGLHVSAKVNSNDFTRGGLGEDEALELCRIYAKAGVDSIEVSGNGTSVAGVRAGVGEGYFAPFAVRLVRAVDVPVILVGGMRSRAVMEAALNEVGVDFVSLSRPLLREPDLPARLERGLADKSACISCNACYGSHEHRCVFRR